MQRTFPSRVAGFLGRNFLMSCIIYFVDKGKSAYLLKVNFLLGSGLGQSNAIIRVCTIGFLV